MADEKGEQIKQLHERMLSVERLPGEDDFFTKTETLVRFLKAREWNVDEAEKQLRAAVEWRRKTNPLKTDCQWCHDQPGYHGIRQVGFDASGRPVIYACFAQVNTTKSTVEDNLAHMICLIENAKRTMIAGVTSWIFIMDCTGMSLPVCNPRLGYGITSVMSDYYPERLGQVICINHSPVFQGVWNAIKVFLHPNTVAKMQLVRKKKKYKEEFARLFDEELTQWLLDEIKLNKQRPLSASQKDFWKPPENGTSHDPRGCPSYVVRCVNTYLETFAKDPENVHRPHPNIVDVLNGTIKSSCSGMNGKVNGKEPDISEDPSASKAPSKGHDHEACNSSDDDLIDERAVDSVHIDEEFQILEHTDRIQL